MSKTLITKEMISKLGELDKYADRYGIYQVWLCRHEPMCSVSLSYGFTERWNLEINTETAHLDYHGIKYMEDLIYALLACGLIEIVRNIKQEMI